MLVILAGSHDYAARTLLARWADRNVALLTCEDLSKAGWRHYLDPNQESTAVISGKVVKKGDIDGVLTRLPFVPEDELTAISPEDRPFVTSEMHAFLVSWLSSLRCPVLNPPTPACLCGPNWRLEEWLHTAAKLGIPVSSTNNRTDRASQDVPSSVNQHHTVSLTIVGDHSIGSVAESLKIQARELADEANVDLLRVSFTGRERGSPLASADLWVDVADPVISAAILEYLEEENASQKWSVKE